MPELPEVETIRLTLKPKLIGRKITQVSVLLPRMLQNVSLTEFIHSLKGQTIEKVERRGKYILISLTSNLILAIHLRMTGQLAVEKVKTEASKTTYCQFTLDDGFELRFADVRKFGKILLYPSTQVPAVVSKLGAEPLEAEFTPEVLKKGFGRRNLAVKKALLSQEIVAGLGNIYTDEALFVAGIHPARPVNSLTDVEIEKLHQAIHQVLSEGIEHRGTTKRDYRDGEGHPGSHQDYLRVYGRKGMPCVVCGSPIVKMNFGGRGTHFCPMCQV